ncbi:MAG TPA: D-alanyl-D-alanine carboxypeptidase/D-alanyl-D-alanine-endopeptidase [Bryobacteraceae bacterium]|nr:D-alanyl-D-alanine carboxypeptidase/D-alanyl-D-alanine-endopeptidase [Bryobacteraceae bacterium]
MAGLLVAAFCARGADLAQRLEAAVDSGPFAQHSTTGISVIDLGTGKALYSRNASRLFLPASNMKLFTTALALETLGPDYRFTTRLVREPSGNLLLAGSGDPSMNGRVYPYSASAGGRAPLWAIEELADQAAAKGLRRVEGDVVGDDRLYLWEPYPPSWTQDDAVHDSGAPVSALSVADNVLTISIDPGSYEGANARIALEPPLEYFAIDNRAITGAAGSAARVGVARILGMRQILVSGTVPLKGAGVRETAAVDDPALFAACALYDALTRRGVAVAGHPTARHRAGGEAYEEPRGETLAMRTSPPLGELVQVTDKVSENLHAELMLREVGRVAKGEGSREAGLAAMRAFLAQSGATASDLRMDDGSGLSRNDLASPALITRLLAFMYRSRNRDAWISMLPTGGLDGTLSRRLCCTADAGRIHAKTGTLARSIALSGYADSKTRGWLAFSIVVNNFDAPAPEIRSWVDKIAMTLTE